MQPQPLTFTPTLTAVSLSTFQLFHARESFLTCISRLLIFENEMNGCALVSKCVPVRHVQTDIWKW